MLLQTQPTSVKLMQILSQLGGGIRDIVDPQFEERRATENFLLQNPERARSLMRTQQEQERQFFSRPEAREAATIDPDTEPGEEPASEPAGDLEEEMPNVMERRGFDAAEGRQLLEETAPPLTPEERVPRETAETALESDLPQLRVMAERAGLDAEESVASFKEVFFDTRDPELRGLAENMSMEAQLVASQLEKEQAQEYARFRERAINGEVPGIRKGDILLAESSPQALSARLTRERMDLRERLDKLDRLQERREMGQELSMERLDVAMELRDRSSETLEQIFEAKREGNDDELNSLTRQYNELVGQAAEFDQNMAVGMLGTLTEGFLGGIDVEFTEVPQMATVVGDNPELIDPTLKLFTRSRTDLPDGFMDNLPETVETREDLERFAGEAVSTLLNQGGETSNAIRREFARVGILPDVRETLGRNIMRQLEESDEIRIADNVNTPDPITSDDVAGGRIGVDVTGPGGGGPNVSKEDIEDLRNLLGQFYRNFIATSASEGAQ